MCTTVCWPDENKEVVITLGQLKRHFDVEPDDYALPNWEDNAYDEMCLCGVDVAGVLTRAGVQYHFDTTFAEYIVLGPAEDVPGNEDAGF